MQREAGRKGGHATNRKLEGGGLPSERLGPLETIADAQRWLKRRWIADAVGAEPGAIVVYVVGLGAGVVDQLEDKGFRVTAFNGGTFGYEQRRFLNVWAEAARNPRKLLEEGEIAIPRDPKLFHELLATNWISTADGKVRIEAKPEIKSRLGRSPDRADAVMMAMSEQTVGRAMEFGSFSIV